MESRIIVLGESNEFLVDFCKYLISRNSEIYLALKKNQELPKFKEIEGYITIIKYNDDLDEIKFLLNSIEPKLIYNLYGIQHKTDLKHLIEKNYLSNILLLEALRASKSTMLINLIERTQRDDKGNPLSLYSAIVDSLNNINLFYKDFYKIETITKYRDEYESSIKI